MDLLFEGSWKSGKIKVHASSQKEADARVHEYLSKLEVLVVPKSDDRVAVEIATSNTPLPQ